MVKKKVSEFVEGSEKTIFAIVIGLIILSWVVFADGLEAVPEPDCLYGGSLCIYDGNDVSPPSESNTYTNTETGFDLPITIEGYNFEGPVKVHLRVVDCESNIVGEGPADGYGPIYESVVNVELHLDSGVHGPHIIEVYTGTGETGWYEADSFQLNPAPGQEETDFDGDGIPDLTDPDDDNDGVVDEDDRCPWTVLPEIIPAGGDPEVLSPNNYADVDGDGVFETNTGSKKKPVIEDSSYSLTDTFGCSCEQILSAKPGDNDGELLHGCSKGTMNVFIGQTGWSAECFDVCGIVKGASKKFMENTDDGGMPDILDSDNDNDGVSDSVETDEGTQVDDAQEDGTPDWWCNKNPKKC